MADPPEMRAFPNLERDWTTADWDTWWNATPHIPFQINKYNPVLLEQEKMIFPDSDRKYRVFFPLCGKSYDMKWVADKGHKVIGLDCAVKPLVDFFKEHDITFEEQQDGEFKVFNSAVPGCDVTLYAGDIFDLHKASFENCDAVYDYGSIVVIKQEERKMYAEAIHKMTTSDVNYLLCAFDFDGYISPRPPAYQASPEMVHEAFGEFYNVKQILDISRERFIQGVPKPITTEKYYFLSKK